MVLNGLPLERMSLQDVELRRNNGRGYHHQRIEVRLDQWPRAFLASLEDSLDRWASNATLAQHNGTVWRVAVQGLPTHELVLRFPEQEAPGPEPAPTPSGPGRLAVVIDDLGESVAYARDLAALDMAVTFSVWPHATSAVQVAELAHAAGKEVLMHQPMEPMDPAAKPGPGALYVRMSAQELRATLADNLARVPHAAGLNNHMGSRLTRNPSAMAVVLGELKARNLMALDSLTHPDTRMAQVGARIGLPVLERDVFLDVVQDEEAILHQLEKAAHIARVAGDAVAIGHPYPETLAALRRWAARSPRPVRTATLAELSGRAPAPSLARQ
jgi:hypothetical protein